MSKELLLITFWIMIWFAHIILAIIIVAITFTSLFFFYYYSKSTNPSYIWFLIFYLLEWKKNNKQCFYSSTYTHVLYFMSSMIHIHKLDSRQLGILGLWFACMFFSLFWQLTLYFFDFVFIYFLIHTMHYQCLLNS